MPEIASPQSKYRGQQLPPDRQSFFYLCRSADDQYSVRPAPIAPLMAKPNCFLSTRFPTPPPLSSEHLILFPRSAGPLSTLSQAVHLYEDKENGASLLISRTNSSFSVRGVLGPDRAIRPRPDSAAPYCPLIVVATKSQTGATKLTLLPNLVKSPLTGSLLPTTPCPGLTIRSILKQARWKRSRF